MDYKIWITLLMMLLLILYIIKEMYFIKFDILSYINTLKNNSEDSSLILRKNFQNDLNVFANKIKLLNDENLQQFRKITLLNTQPIVKNNNYFKELSCTDSEDNELKYLSDSKLASNHNQIKEDFTSDYSLTSPINVNKKDKNNEIKVEEILIKINDKTVKKDNETDKIEIEQDTNEFFENVSLDTDTETSTGLSNDEDDEEDDDEEDDEEDDDEDDDDDDDDENINQEDHEEVVFEKEELNNINKSTTDKLLESVMDTITLGTKKSKNNKEDKKINHDLKEIGTVKEIMATINKENFKSIDDYNMDYLKNLAKKFNIPLSMKVSGRWKPLTKPEIYNEISKFLNKNI
jgi:hypothetical protein